jgi:hypothetical protein
VDGHAVHRARVALGDLALTVEAEGARRVDGTDGQEDARKQLDPGRADVILQLQPVLSLGHIGGFHDLSRDDEVQRDRQRNEGDREHDHHCRAQRPASSDSETGTGPLDLVAGGKLHAVEPTPLG